MKKDSIAGKIIIRVLFVALVVIAIAGVISYFILNSMKEDVEIKTKNHFKVLIEERIQSKMDVAISNAVTLSQNTDLLLALETNDRSMLKVTLTSLSNAMKNGTNFNNVKIHVHDKDIKSFYRSWQPDKYGDDLSSFRNTILEVKKTKKPLAAIEVGRAGLVLRGLSPIFDVDGKYVGSVEFIQGFNSVVEDFAKDDEFLIVLMDEKLKRGDALSSQDKIGKYYLSQKVFDKEFRNSLEKIDFNRFEKTGFTIDKNFFYTRFPILDFKGQKQGFYILADHVEQVNNTFDESAKLVYTMLGMMAVLTILLVITIIYFFNKIISGGLNKFKKSFAEFLDFITFKTNSFKKPAVYTSDEVADMLVLLNNTADEFDKKLKDDMRVIGEIVLTTDKVEQGIYRCRIHSSSDNPMIVTLKDTINKMLDTVDKNMIELIRTVTNYANDDFTDKVEISPKLKAKMLEVMESTNKLGLALSQSAKRNLHNGQTLEKNADMMNSSMKNLAAKANEQAASLEETAAALEEITSITRSNANNASKMATLGETVKQSVKSGESLASKTAFSMDEINEKVSSINEAITVIDQIAFQTNILSLNAAVEAATAGEAGKGFAVVAQEVRNLASRSAEAAKEIKDLVEDANLKANEGKNISAEMIHGYQELNTHINETLHLIENVSSASKEQMTGIEQINDTVTMLDRVTQENANEANQVRAIANDVSSMAKDLVEDALSKKFN
ncbi:methyl-accepting chemotaxis protein [Arcobacter arenosus]|uniref:Chemotaxis protein n=1 Tax=Arcobacter arenosus TaxID=2576037 RepID=A0A5R8Y4G4_9BACT|nr:methyl-accepting chemotaxis protein [Arcobacter arenosus]TLP41009.1 chemotaxis protein [Arcobacter arenosus]